MPYMDSRFFGEFILYASVFMDSGKHTFSNSVFFVFQQFYASSLRD